MVQAAWKMAMITKTMMQPMTLYKLMPVRLEFQPLVELSSGSPGLASAQREARKFQGEENWKIRVALPNKASKSK